MQRAIACATLAWAAHAHAATIYLCEAYGGGTFWSSANCSSQKASIKRIVSVPDGLPFAQQVQLGEQVEGAGRMLQTAPERPALTVPPPHNSKATECASLNEHIRVLDAEARQPQSGSSQDRITTQRRAVRDRQFWIGCR